MKKSRKYARRNRDDCSCGGRGRAVGIGGQLDVARCPICDGPMTPRYNRGGSYFYCLCYARRQQGKVKPVIKSDAALRTTTAGAERPAAIECDTPAHLPIPACNSNLSSVG
jgi:hypothetical protein